MASQDEIDPLDRFLHDDDYSRTVARFHIGSASTPRQPPFAGFGNHGWATSDAAAYVSSHCPEYTTSTTGARTSRTYGSDDDDSLRTPADFMRTSVSTAVSSQPRSSSGGSEYTAVYRAPSTYSSDASSVAPSIFTRGSTRTSAGLSSQPPRRADITNFNQVLAAGLAADLAPANHTQPIVPAAATHPLWCELCVLGDCPATFRIDQTPEWIEHHCRHLKDRYPRRLVCWFCDHVPFVASGRSNNERYSNFRDRMEHIREHISGEYLTRDHMRPDFSMINHLADKGIIGNVMRDLALGYSELPAALRLPGSSAGGSVPLEQPQRRPPGPSLAYDLDRERRHQRPRGGQRHQPASLHYA